MKEKKVPVSLFLANGIKLQGRITNFDNRSVILANNGVPQVAMLQAISTIVPSEKVDLKGLDLFSDADYIDLEFVEMLKDNEAFCKFYLVNGVGLSGYIAGYDDTCYLLANNNIQLIMGTAVSTITPNAK